MNATIKCIDKRRCCGHSVTFLNNTTYEEVLSFIKKHRNATSVFLFKSPKHENGGFFYTKDNYLKYMRQGINAEVKEGY